MCEVETLELQNTCSKDMVTLPALKARLLGFHMLANFTMKSVHLMAVMLQLLKLRTSP